MALPGLEKLSTDVAAARASKDPVSYLFAEHAWTRLVLDEMRALVTGPARGLSLDDVLEFEAAIDLHIRREEEAFFPILEPIALDMGLGSTSDMYGEHDAIRIRLEELQAAVSSGADLTGPLAALRRALVVHFDNEEELLFYEPAERLTQDARAEVLTKFEMLEAK